MAELVVLNDGETYTDRAGCFIVSVPDDVNEDDLDLTMFRDQGKPVAPIVSIPQVYQLHVIIDAAARGARVRWLASDGYTILEGTARHIVQSPDNFGFLGGDQDVRDGYLRITSVTGMEHAVPVRRLMALVDGGGFAVDS